MRVLAEAKTRDHHPPASRGPRMMASARCGGDQLRHFCDQSEENREPFNNPWWFSAVQQQNQISERCDAASCL
jgi:hypothetical protein